MKEARFVSEIQPQRVFLAHAALTNWILSIPLRLPVSFFNSLVHFNQIILVHIDIDLLLLQLEVVPELDCEGFCLETSEGQFKEKQSTAIHHSSIAIPELSR
jgi:hypothetical protein